MNLQEIFYILAIVYIVVSLVIVLMVIIIITTVLRRIRRFRQDMFIRRQILMGLMGFRKLKKIFNLK